MLGWGVPTLDSHYVFHYLYESAQAGTKLTLATQKLMQRLELWKVKLILKREMQLLRKLGKL